MSIFPRSENICTRIPIHVRLRRTEKPLAPRLVVWNKSTEKVEQTITMIPTDSGHYYVRAAMEEILLEEQGQLKGIVMDKIIILHIDNPSVPSLDLVDLPGLVSVPNEDEPENMMELTKACAEGHIDEFKDNSIFLGTLTQY